MKEIILVISLSLVWIAAEAQRNNRKSDTGELPLLNKYLDAITENELSAQLHFIASDYFLGRKAGSDSERAIANYLAAYYKSMGVAPLNGNAGSPLERYFQEFPLNDGAKVSTSQNVLSLIEGTDPVLKNEVVVLIAHYDHLGIGSPAAGDSIFNGAADDGSGTVALLEIAESFMEAKRDGSGTRRSLLFLHAGAEESGLVGSTYYVGSPLVPLHRISAVINLDGVAGTDKPGAGNGAGYVYLLYNDSTSRPLAELTHQINDRDKINLDILKPENPQRFNSDSRSFEYELLPSLYFSSGLTEHYHKVSDEPSTIDYTHMARIVKLVFAVTWELANTQVKEAAVNRGQFAKTGRFFCVPCGCPSDGKDFSARGYCPDCRMALQPGWRRHTEK